MSTAFSPTTTAPIRPASASLARALGERVATFTFEDLPAAAIDWAKVGILDTVGVTLAGAREPAATLLTQVLGPGAGDAVVFGSTQRASALDAALINGTASHALDFDDCNNTFGGHPSVPILPALFALADERGATGPDFITAYVAGFEVETKIAMSVHFHHYMKGWHPTATLGVFGAAAATSRLLGLDATKTATAIAIAASMSSGIKANFGTMTKPMHVGHCARDGLLAARLAQAGFTANGDDVFEHEQGFFEVYNGAGNYDAARGIDAWAAPLDIIRPGLAIKQYPCCGSTHPAIDAAIEIAQSHAFECDDIERVDVWIHPRRLQHTNRPLPQSDLDAKFSVQYVVARALLDQRVTLQHFEQRRFQETDVAALTRKVNAVGYDVHRFPADNHFGGEVRVTLKSGAVYTAKVDQPLGRTSANPLPAARLQTKYEACAAMVLNDAAVRQSVELLTRFEALTDVRELTRLFTGTSNLKDR